MENLFKTNDPAKARVYFENKLAYTTGPVELEHALKSGGRFNVVDVRESDDFARGHIPGAINLPKENWDNATGLQKDRLNIFYCYSQTCHLATNAALRFAKEGYPVMELEGGFDGWKHHEYDIERTPINRLKRHGLVMHHRM
jgi:rhodanese-related sulfurtransferase